MNEINKKYYVIASHKLNANSCSTFVSKIIIDPNSDSNTGIELSILYSKCDTPLNTVLQHSALCFDNSAEANSILNILINKGYIEFQLIEVNMNVIYKNI